MRIVYVINSLEGGGAAFPVPAVARVLAKHGAKVSILALTRRNGRALAPMQAAGLEVRVRGGGEGDHLSALAWLDREVAQARPDVIWTSLTRATLLGQIVGRRRRITVVSWQHNAHLKPANRLLLRATQALTTLWICDSESVAQLTAERLGVEPARRAVWPLFAAEIGGRPARRWRPGEMLRLGSLGRLHPAKGYDVLVAALSRLQAEGFEPPAPFEVALAGEGAARGELEQAIAAAGIGNLRLAGFAERPREFLSGLHLYLQPSRAEGLCIAMHEAMQAGLPTLVSSVGEMPHTVVDGVTGLVVPPGDPVALADALARLLRQPDKLAGMGAAARSRVLDRFGVAAFERAGGEVMARLGRP